MRYVSVGDQVTTVEVHEPGGDSIVHYSPDARGVFNITNEAHVDFVERHQVSDGFLRRKASKDDEPKAEEG